MAKKPAKATQFSNDLSSAGTGSAPKKTSASRTQKHLKAQASGVVAAVEGFVSAITSTPVETKVAEPVAEAPVIPATVATEAPTAAAISKEVTHEEIAVLAYTFYLNRRAEGGSQAEDWFRAEQTLKAS